MSKKCKRCDDCGGVETVVCCCGHGVQNGNIVLADGRHLIIMNEEEDCEEIKSKKEVR